MCTKLCTKLHTFVCVFQKAAPVQVKKEEVFNAAEEWIKAGSDAGSDDDDDDADLNKSLHSDSDEDDSDEEFDDSDDDSGDGSDDDNDSPNRSQEKATLKSRPHGVNESDSDNDLKMRSDNDKPFTLLGDMSSDQNGRVILSKKEKKQQKKKLSPEEKLKAQEEERINILRKKLRLSVSGGGVPTPIESFDDLQTVYGVSSNLINNLRKSGYTEPTPIQAQTWPIMLQVKDLYEKFVINLLCILIL